MLEVEPLHIVWLPLIAAVGRAFTVTTALPVKSALIEVQCASVNAVTIYVFVDEGLTVKVYGLVVIPFTVTGVVPLV